MWSSAMRSGDHVLIVYLRGGADAIALFPPPLVLLRTTLVVAAVPSDQSHVRTLLSALKPMVEAVRAVEPSRRTPMQCRAAAFEEAFFIESWDNAAMHLLGPPPCPYTRRNCCNVPMPYESAGIPGECVALYRPSHEPGASLVLKSFHLAVS